jgi:rare lipoprotein A
MKNLALALAMILPTTAAANDETDDFDQPAAFHQEGTASWYGPRFAGRRTASGERFNPSRLTIAHRTLQLGTTVRITNLRNQRSVVARVTDRGPYVRGRVADLSSAAASAIGMKGSGTAPVLIVAN